MKKDIRNSIMEALDDKYLIKLCSERLKHLSSAIDVNFEILNKQNCATSCDTEEIKILPKAPKLLNEI